jgi:predicted patatin/cPLA2 family phospholipase
MTTSTSHRLGLVLEGGGFRAHYTAGVLDVLIDEALPIAGVIGVSMGAIHGASFVSGQKGRSLEIYTRYAADERLWSLWRWVRTGNLIDPTFCYREIPDRLVPFDEEAFENSGKAFYACASNLETGRPEYLRLPNLTDDIDGLRASASLPYVSPAVEFRGMKLLDGGCTDRIPLAAFERMGFTHNIVIQTHPREHAVRDRDAWAAKWWYAKYPKFVESFQKSPEVYEATQRLIDERVKEGHVFSIRPERPIPVGRLSRDPEDVRRAYGLGVEDAKKALPALLQWVNQ